MTDNCLLDRILEPGNISVRFQPVWTVQGAQKRPHYFEALVRGPAGSTAESPLILFEYARRKGQEATVDRACVRAVLAAVRDLPAGAVVGINVHASTLALDIGFPEYLREALQVAEVSFDRLIVEVVEHAPPWNVPGFRLALDRLRDHGARIALDDVGLGHSNFMMMIECCAEYLKVDRYFVHGCHSDLHRRAVLAAVVQLAQAFRARVVAEGVEDPADLSVVGALGIALVQGFLLAAAAPAAEITRSLGLRAA